MGGSGGYGYGRSGNIPLKPTGLEDTIARTRNQADSAEVAATFGDALAEINQTDTEALNQHKVEVLAALKDEFPDAFDMHGGGSYTRRTYVDGLSDVDLLLDLGPYSASKIADKDNPQAVIAAMRERLEQRFPNSQITDGRMAVTLTFSDGLELQVLPAYRYRGGYRVPDLSGTGWTVTRPRVFAQLLRDRNAEVGGKLLPCIKLAKQICSAQGVEIKSYHLENMAVRAFEGYSGPKTHEAMLRHLFNQAKMLAAAPMKDVTGQDTHVDRYLDSTTSRNKLAKDLANLERRIADAQGNSAEWRKLLNLPD